MKAFITACALTRGIEELDVQPCELDPETVQHYFPSYGYRYYHKGEWHTDIEAARARVREIIVAKERSTRRLLEKLEKMKGEYA